MRNVLAVVGVALVSAACGGSDDSGVMQPVAGGGDASASLGGSAGTTGLGGTAGGGATGVGGTVAIDGAAGAAPVDGAAPDTGCSGDACVPYPITDASSLVGSGGQLFLFGSDIYFALGSGNNTGQVGKVSKSGGAITWIATQQGSPRGVTTDGQTVFWADIALHTVRAAPASGAGPVTTLWGPASAIGPDIVLIDPVLYFVDGSPGQIMSIDKASTTAQSFAAVQARSLAADAAAVYFTTQGGDVVRAPVGGGSAPIATGQTQPTSVAVNATHACWVSGAAGSKVVACALLTGGAVTTMQANAIALAMDDQFVYWAMNPAPGTIEKAHVDATGRTTLADNQPFPFDIAVDTTTLYWTSETQRSVFAIAK